MNRLLRGVSAVPGPRHIQVARASPAPHRTSPPRGRSTPTRHGRRAGSGGGDSPAAGAEMPPAAVSPNPGGDSRPVGRAGAWLPLRDAPAAPGPAAPSARASPPPHNRPGGPRPGPPPPPSRLPGLPGRRRRPNLTCHVPNSTRDGGASRPREGRGQHFTADKGRRHVRAGRNRPRWLPGWDFRRWRSARPRCATAGRRMRLACQKFVSALLDLNPF